MKCLVISSELLVRSRRKTVRSPESLVGSRVFKLSTNISNDCKMILPIVVLIFVLATINFVSIPTAYAAEPQLKTQNSELKTGSPSPFDEIKKAYAEIKTLEAQFNQRIFISSLKKERDSKGEFFFKRQKGFLWRYKTPKVQYFLYDGKFIWQGEDDKPFVTKNKIDKEKTGGTFFDLVEDIAKIDELFTLKEQKIEGNFEVLELIPKKEGTVLSAKIWIDKQKWIKKIEIHEFTGNINAIEFTAIKANQTTDDSKFVFKPDGKKEIVER